jgi:ABC-type transport system involved in cytochrome bd biosynthesis fused ATPase/permease subunit
MDFITYAGAGLGIILALCDLRSGRTDFKGTLRMILLAVEFFLPMRNLGSFFHVAMNGISASTRIFHLIDLPDSPARPSRIDEANLCVTLDNVYFQYESNREILHNVSITIPQGKLVAIVGESGSGKSTIVQLISGMRRGYSGHVRIGSQELSEIDEIDLMDHVTVVSHDSYVFKGTIRSNLEIAKRSASDEEMWSVLREANLAKFADSEGGLNTVITEKGSNLSGGQRQRLALARALLADSPIYVFDEATSNIDIESETAVVQVIHRLAERKTVLLISHRLANVVQSARIYVMEHGSLVEHGTHDELIEKKTTYHHLFASQQNLEAIGESPR